MHFKALKGSPKGKAQRWQYLLAVGLGRYSLVGRIVWCTMCIPHSLCTCHDYDLYMSHALEYFSFMIRSAYLTTFILVMILSRSFPSEVSSAWVYASPMSNAHKVCIRAHLVDPCAYVWFVCSEVLHIQFCSDFHIMIFLWNDRFHHIPCDCIFRPQQRGYLSSIS